LIIRDDYGVSVPEGGFAMDQQHVVPSKLVGDDLDFPFRDDCNAGQELIGCRAIVEVMAKMLFDMMGRAHER
jgi:hypothetical protein